MALQNQKRQQYHLDLHQQAYKRLTSMQAFGESKREAIKNGTDQQKIYSIITYKNYWRHAKYYLSWLQTTHPECKTLKKARKFVSEYLQQQVDRGLSAWTIHTQAKALGKLFDIHPDDPDYFSPPMRLRANIKRSRFDCEMDRSFSQKNNADLIAFCQGTGLRREELSRLKGGDLFSRSMLQAEYDQLRATQNRTETQDKYMGVLQDALGFSQDYFVHVRRGKGGRQRIVPIVGPDVNEIVDRMRGTDPDKRVWEKIHTGADIHSYRADYAARIYREYARPIDQIPYDRVNNGSGCKYQGDVYVCRNDQANKKFDRLAMRMCSKALGHNRVSVVATNYSYKL